MGMLRMEVERIMVLLGLLTQLITTQLEYMVLTIAPQVPQEGLSAYLSHQMGMVFTVKLTALAHRVPEALCLGSIGRLVEMVQL